MRHEAKTAYSQYRNRPPYLLSYFNNFLQEYSDYTHNLRNDLIRLPVIRCEFDAINVKYQNAFKITGTSKPQ